MPIYNGPTESPSECGERCIVLNGGDVLFVEDRSVPKGYIRITSIVPGEFEDSCAISVTAESLAVGPIRRFIVRLLNILKEKLL